MVLAGVDFWYDNYGLWPWQAKPRPKTIAFIHLSEMANPIKSINAFYPNYWTLISSAEPDEAPKISDHDKPHFFGNKTGLFSSKTIPKI